MTALSVYPVCVGWGIASALGASARHTGFYLRAGRNNFSLSPFVDALGDAVTVSCVTTLPKDLAGPARLAALAASSLEEALMTIGEFSDDRRIRVYFVLPTRYAAQAGKSLNAEGNRVISALVEQSAFRRYRSEIEPMPLGAAGGARALVRAAQALGSNEIDLAILLGVDSYYDWPVLERLRKEDRLLTPDTVDGLRPGEAGACMVLVAPHHRFARSAGVSRFVAAGEGHEPSLPGVDSPPNM
ncbi:MAG TPA: hypothetical protein VGL13_06160, partial [Polyangiaceae bacterium]